MRRVFAGFCKFQVVLDATVSPSWLVRKLRFTALYWPSNGVSLQKRRPKLLQATTQALKNCSILKILFFSIDGLNRDTAPHRFDDANRYACAPRSHLASGDRDRDG